MTTATLRTRTQAVTRLADTSEARLNASRELAVRTEESLARTTGTRDLAFQAHAILGAVSEALREEVKQRVEVVVAAALQAIFGTAYHFRFDAKVSRGVVSLTPLVGYGEDLSTARWVGADSVGGGVVDVVAFALRVAVLLLRRPKLRPVLFADEPFKHVSDEFLPSVAEMLRRLATDMGLQLFVISHEEAVAAAANKVFYVSMKDGVSQIVDTGAP